MPNSIPDSYFRLFARGLRRSNEEAFTSLCFEHGAHGVSEELRFQQLEMIYDPTVVETERLDLNAYFSSQPGEELLLLVRGRFPEAEIQVLTEPHQDWMENWKKGFEPFLFVEHPPHAFWIVPSWREAPPEAKQKLVMDPGMAFGTGTHETTRLAARLVLGQWERLKESAAPRVLDVGTGTGVLAIVAERMGASETTAIDIDPEARRVARENIRLNGAERISIPEKPLDEMPTAAFDLVIANIIDGVLVSLRQELFRVLKPGGTLILSGVLTEREGPFLEEFLAGTSLRNRRRATMGEWSSFVIR